MDLPDDNPPAKRPRVENGRDTSRSPPSESPPPQQRNSANVPSGSSYPVSADLLGETLSTMATSMSSIVEFIKKWTGDSVETFKKSCVPMLVKSFGIYESSFKRLGVSSKTGIEQLCSSNYQYDAVRDGFEYLSEVEDEWDQILSGVDRRLQLKTKTQGLKVNDHVPGDLQLYSVHDNKNVTLRDYQDTKPGFVLDTYPGEIEDAGGRLVVVSLADSAGAREWMPQINSSFDFLLDRDRNLYKAIGLGQSIAQVWSIETIMWYTEQMVSGRQTYSPSKQDDIHQLGGDLLVGSDGRVLLLHAGTSPIDRPEISTIISLMRANQDGK